MQAEEITLRPAAPPDEEFAWQVHNATIKPMVTQVWGWDEAWQRNAHMDHFRQSPPQIIVCDGQDAGVWATHSEPSYIHVDTLLILPAWQRRGVGSYLLRSELSAAAAQGKAVRLQVFRINLPARAFYAHLGFQQVEETATHLILEARLPHDGEERP